MIREEKTALLVDELEDIRCNNFDADTDEDKTLKEAVKVIKSLKQESCEDCVSRKAAIIQLSHNKTGDDDCDVIIQSDIETIKALPPVIPQQRTGRWIINQDSTGRKYGECSECMMCQSVGPLNYCPNCGSKMEVEE